MRRLALAVVLGAMAISGTGLAAGIDSRAYTCPALQGLVVTHGYIFIGNFGDFVVANSALCSGGERVQLRTVPTVDRAECPVNYCVPTFDNRPD